MNEEMKEPMYNIELIKLERDGSISCSQVVDAYEDAEQALNYVWDHVSSWYNKDWDQVLVNDPDGYCIFATEPDYKPNGSERYKWIDHYDWIVDIDERLKEACENVDINYYDNDVSIEMFCYSKTFNELIEPFEPVDAHNKRVNVKEYENMLDDLQAWFESSLKSYKEVYDMKKDKRYKIKMTSCNCMPERSQAFNYNKPVMLSNNDMTKQYIACKDWINARVGVIRAIRKEQRRFNLAYTIGITNNTGRVLFTRNLYTFNKYDLIYLLNVYKALKEKTGLQDAKPVLIKLKIKE